MDIDTTDGGNSNSTTNNKIGSGFGASIIHAHEAAANALAAAVAAAAGVGRVSSSYLSFNTTTLITTKTSITRLSSISKQTQLHSIKNQHRHLRYKRATVSTTTAAAAAAASLYPFSFGSSIVAASQSLPTTTATTTTTTTASTPVNAATSQASLSHEDNGPILYDEPNRTSAIDDIRSGVIYAFIFTLFFTFFLILPGIRNEKFPTILCIVPSLLVASIIVISIFGTTWHVGEAPNMSGAYKAFSRDRIQGELNVRIGLHSVNISLSAYKYYVLHATDGPIIMENTALFANKVVDDNSVNLDRTAANREFEEFDQDNRQNNWQSSSVTSNQQESTNKIERKRSTIAEIAETVSTIEREDNNNNNDVNKQPPNTSVWADSPKASTKTTLRRLNVDINYNERFYWIEPQQMLHEYHQALERGLPYPILTVVEYLSQDEAGFNWSRQYRAAGYYASILLWLSLSVCILMFCLHCAAPKYGIYTMQLLGLILLFTNLTYALSVPRGKRELVIPFEGQSLRFRFGWNFWLVMIGGCVSLCVGTLIVAVDYLMPNFIFTTVLDVDFDRNSNESRRKQECLDKQQRDKLALEDAPEKKNFQYQELEGKQNHRYVQQKPKHPPFMTTSRKQNWNDGGSRGKAQNNTQQAGETMATRTNVPRQRHSPKNRRRESLRAHEDNALKDMLDVRL